MAKKHMASVNNEVQKLKLQRENWLKVCECPKCGKPAHKQVYHNEACYSHFLNDVYNGAHVVRQAPRAAELPRKK